MRSGVGMLPALAAGTGGSRGPPCRPRGLLAAAPSPEVPSSGPDPSGTSRPHSPHSSAPLRPWSLAFGDSSVPSEAGGAT